MNAEPGSRGQHSEVDTAPEQAKPTPADALWSEMQIEDPSQHPPAQGLTLPHLNVYGTRSTILYAITSIDVWGRASDRSLVHALGWSPGQAIALSVRHAAIAVRPSNNRRHRITRQGHLRIHASVRHLLRLNGGDRLLLAACVDRDLLVAYPMPAVDAMLVAYHSSNGT